MRELAERNWHRWLLKYWFYSVVAISVSVSIGFVIGYAIEPQLSQIVTPLEPSEVLDRTKILFGPSITILGISVAFMPVISFFLVNDLKEGKENSMEQWKEKEAKFKENKELATEENLRLVNNYCAFDYSSWVNVICGVMQYARTFISASLLSMIILIVAFIGAPSGWFVLVDIWLLTSMLMGIFPILSMAFHKPALRFRDYIIVERIETRIEPE
jgi:hypothetical protein